MMNRKKTIQALLLLLLLSGTAGLVFLNKNLSPATLAEPVAKVETKPVPGSEELVGTWKLVSASVTPDFLKVPIPIDTFEASGTVTGNRTYAIEANGSFFGSNYGYLGNGDIDIQKSTFTLTIHEGVIIVNDAKKIKDRKGKTITGSYHVTEKDTLQVEAVKYQKGVGYRFNLKLVNS